MTIFARTRGSRIAPAAAPAVQDDSLAAKLASEARVCPTCAFSIANPMTDRCPRCFTLVPLSEHTNCGECSHQGNCEVARLMQKTRG